MAITITKADVKRKCMIPSTDSSYDTQVDSLIAEMKPGIEYTIADAYLNNPDGSLQAAITLGILEVISGEFLEQLSREPGASEQFTIAGVTIGERKEKGEQLKAQGQGRLAPFLKASQPMMSDSQVLSTTLNAENRFSVEDSIW